jgi:methionine-rich copper-binding protein CopC
VHDPPAHVKIWFTERLEPTLSKIQVFDASGQQVDKRDVQADKSDAALLSVSLRPLQPGKYKVVWRVGMASFCWTGLRSGGSCSCGT